MPPNESDRRFRLAEGSAQGLAEAFETPLYVIDETHLRARIRQYRQAARAAWPNSEVAFASKANSTLAVLAIAAEEGCLLDVASEGELRAALLAGVPASRCHLHGNNKSPRELAFAFAKGVSEIVVDNFPEIERIAELAQDAACPDLVLRLAPGVDPQTHAKISTGQADTKFGFNIADGSAEKALLRCLELGLPVAGVHCHVGSQLLDPEAQISGGELIAGFAVEMFRRHGWEPRIVNAGGGLGVRYTDADRPIAIEDYTAAVAEGVRKAFEGTGRTPTLIFEPGRSLVAESGVTLYTVGVVKTVPTQSGPKTYVCVDGGLADNPRPVMYGAKYTVERVAAGLSPAPSPPSPFSSSENGEGASATFTISGRHCETDLLFPGVTLPSDVAPGDLLQVLCTGAYGSSMASNYNRYPRPATALIRPDGSFELVQRREEWSEMFARESVPADLMRQEVAR